MQGSKWIKCLYNRLGLIQQPLCLSSSRPNSKSRIQMDIEGERELQLNSDSSSVAQSAFFQPPSETEKERVPSTNPSIRPVCEHLERQVVPSISQNPKTNRISIIKQNLPNNLSEVLKNRVSDNLASSSSDTYERYWKNFLSFCENKVNLNNVNKVVVYEFFNHLIDRKLVYKTLLCYRSALKRPLRALLPDFNLVEDEIISNLLRYAKTNFKKKSQKLVWDLDKVIHYVKCISKNNLELYFKKCFFLTLLASPKRISEIKAQVISRMIECTDGSIILRPHSKFIKKNNTESFYPEDVTIPEFKDDVSICPVKHLKDYIKLTKKMCQTLKIKRPDQLWVDLKGKPLQLHKIRIWFRDIVLAGDSNASIENTNFHSIRAIAASTLDFKRIPIDVICQHMQWSRSSTFIDFYSKLDLKVQSQAVIAGLVPIDTISSA